MNSHDEPPMSRLFVICNKTNTEDELREAFQKFGTIDDIFLVKDHKSGENKGNKISLSINLLIIYK